MEIMNEEKSESVGLAANRDSSPVARDLVGEGQWINGLKALGGRKGGAGRGKYRAVRCRFTIS